MTLELPVRDCTIVDRHGAGWSSRASSRLLVGPSSRDEALLRGVVHRQGLSRYCTSAMSARSAATCELSALRPLLVKDNQVVRRPACVPL